MMSEIEEIAKATQELAKTGNNAIDKGAQAGTFIAKYIDAPLTEISGIWHDKLKYRRWENQLNLWNKANKKLKSLGLEIPSKELPLKLGLPLIEAASLEDDNELQELWANLLVNSSTTFSLERSYISVLEQLSSLEAKILLMIYDYMSNTTANEYEYDDVDIKKVFNNLENEHIDIRLALVNLSRLHCISYVDALGGEIYGTSLFGAKLYEAVKEPTKQ